MTVVRAEPNEVLGALEAAFDGGPAVLPVAEPARAELLADLQPGAGVPDDVALVVATSGSTGRRKGVLLTQSALEHAARAGLRRMQADPQLPWLCVLPVDHIAGIMVLVRALVSGTSLITLPRLELAALAAPAHVALVPTQVLRLVDAGADLASLGVILVGGGPAAPDLLPRARAAGGRVIASYGMTETCGGCVYDGVALDEMQVLVDDSGRIRVRGPALLRGYLSGGAVEDPLQDGWFTTADLGRIDAAGRLEVLGRADDVIVTGGVNVVAGRVAALLEGHPSVHAAAVVGRPDPEWGTRVVAVVEPAAGAAAPSLATVRAFVRERATAAEAPRELVVLTALPRLPGGKVDRSRIERVVMETHEQEEVGGGLAPPQDVAPIPLLASATGVLGFAVIFSVFATDSMWSLIVGGVLLVTAGLWAGRQPD